MSDAPTGSGSPAKPPAARRTRWLRLAGAALAALAAVQFGSYFWLADEAMPRAGIAGLADYRGIRGCAFAAVGEQTWARMGTGQREALERELRRHVAAVYRSFDAIPESGKLYEPISDYERWQYARACSSPDYPAAALENWRKKIEAGRKLVGLKDGMLFSWKLESRGLFWMRCSSGCYTGNLGAEGGADVYCWVLGFWVRLCSEGHWMA